MTALTPLSSLPHRENSKSTPLPSANTSAILAAKSTTKQTASAAKTLSFPLQTEG
jgi:hypothetical protein